MHIAKPINSFRSCFLICSLALLVFSCTKEKESITPADTNELPRTILHDFSIYVAFANYTELELRATALNDAIESLTQNPNDTHIATARKRWLEARESWEKSESFLFGPVATQSLDPAIDDWPMNRN